MPKVKRITPVSFVATPFTAEQQETMFKRDYEFNKPVPVRSPVSGWLWKNPEGLGSKESSLIKGLPHSFKGIRTGNSYGKRLAVKRIGKK